MSPRGSRTQGAGCVAPKPSRRRAPRRRPCPGRRRSTRPRHRPHAGPARRRASAARPRAAGAAPDRARAPCSQARNGAPRAGARDSPHPPAAGPACTRSAARSRACP
ncbi:hypothetical protein ACFPRL_13155 [Pseudoclavibacter helvolus]